MRVTIIDYGSGNLHSTTKAFELAARETGINTTIDLTDSLIMSPWQAASSYRARQETADHDAVSSGEQALMAMALIFAVFFTDPARSACRTKWTHR